ncbi:hypothetical protein LINPERHAP2_LOCUS7226 [Linum perenne]
MQAISPYRFALLEDYGLHTFAQIGVTAIDVVVMSWVLNQYDYNTHSLILPDGSKKQLSVNDYRSVYVVPAGKTIVLALSIGCLFCPNTSHTVDIRYLSFVRGENLMKFKTYNWAKFGLSNFKSGMFLTKGTKNVAADVDFFTVIYLVDCKKLKGRGDDNSVLHYFTNETVKDYMNDAVTQYCKVNKTFIDEDADFENVVNEDVVDEDDVDAVFNKKDAFIDSSIDHVVSGVGGMTSDEAAATATENVSANVVVD